MCLRPTHKAANSTNPSHAGGVYERIKKAKSKTEWLIFTTVSESCLLFTATYLKALAWLLTLCYQFSINPPHNRRARAPVWVLPEWFVEASALYKPRGLLQLLQWARQRFSCTKLQKGDGRQKDRRETNSLSVSFRPSKDKKMGTLKGCICSVIVEKYEKMLQAGGSIFCPCVACVVSPAKCRKIVRVEEWNSYILPSERGIDGKDGLSMDICLESRGVDDISRA